MTEGAGKKSLVDAVDLYGKQLSSEWVAAYHRRLEPYLEYYRAMELIDPISPDVEIAPAVWSAVKDIYEHFGLAFAEVKKEILDMRDSAENLSRSDAKRCREKYYHDMVRVSIPHCMLTRQLSQVKVLIQLYVYIYLVFVLLHRLKTSLPMCAVLISSRSPKSFSSFPSRPCSSKAFLVLSNYNKDKTRSSLKDETVANIIHTKDLEPVVGNPAQPFSQEAVLNTKRALHVEHKLAL